MDRFVGAFVLREEERQHFLGDLHVRTRRDERLGALQGAREIAGLVGSDGFVQLIIEIDEVLRIVGGGVGGLRRRAGEIAEAEQLACSSLPTFCRAAVCVGASARSLARRAVTLRRSSRETVAQLFRIGGQVVELGDRQVDELAAAFDRADERRPAAIERGGKRLEVGVPALAFFEERSALPLGRRGDAGRDRMVGAMSMWRT